jgi:hypothetical protein
LGAFCGTRYLGTVFAGQKTFWKPDKQKVNNYLVPIQIINEEFKTNYSTKPEYYNITELPSFGGKEDNFYQA